MPLTAMRDLTAMIDLRRQPKYRGSLKAIVFDWAGTVIDYGSRAPVLAVMGTFEAFGVPLSDGEARGPMGMAKRDHIRALLELPRVRSQWQNLHGRSPDESTIDQIYASFLKTQKELLLEHSRLIPGCLDAIADCRRRKMRIGSSTGYTQELMDVVVPAARRQGFEPETMVCASDVARGRPAPWLLYENARRLDVYPMEAIVSVDDTVVGVEAGVNAGTWTVGVAKTGNLIGLSEAEFNSLGVPDQNAHLSQAREQLYRAGACYVADSVADLPRVLDAIQDCLERAT